MHRLLVAALVTVLVLTAAVFIPQLRADFEERCTESWQGAANIDVSRLTLAPEDVGRVSPTLRNVTVGGSAFRIDASISKTMGWASAPRNPFYRQSIGVYFGVWAKDESTLRRLVPLCVSAVFGSDTWERRAHSGQVQFQGITGEAIGGASAGGGPEWPVEVVVRLALLTSYDGTRYVFQADAVPINATD